MKTAIVLGMAAILICAGASFSRNVVPRHEILHVRDKSVPVYYFPAPEIPIFDVVLAFEGGADPDPEEKTGLAAFTTAMLRRGLPGLDENAISLKMDDLAATIDFDVGEERVLVGAHGLNLHAGEIIDMVFNMLTLPTFPEVPFGRLKVSSIDGIMQLSDSPAGLGTYVLDLALFNGTRKSRPVSGFLKDVQKLSLDELRDYFPGLIRADRLKVFVMGGKGKEDVLEPVLRRIESLPCKMCNAPDRLGKKRFFEKFQIPAGGVMLVDRPGISEAHVRMGFPGPKRKVPEFYDLRVADTVLAGQFASRLNRVIRERLNLSYDISAGYDFGEEMGAFRVRTSVQNENVVRLLKEVNREFREFAKGTLTAAEIDTARDYLIGSFPLGLQNRYSLARTFFDGVLEGLPSDFLDVYCDRIKSVSRESIREALEKYFHPDRMVTVVVGDAKVLGPKLKAAGFKVIHRVSGDFL